jgi:hypothetical protein
MIVETLPVVGMDFALRVVPPHGGEIQFADIRKLLVSLRDYHRIPIVYVTFDQFQSVDSRQILAKQGFTVGHQSVEGIEPYRTLKDTIYDTRLLMSPHAYLQSELATLEIVIRNNKMRVDHRRDTTKDVADALCGSVATTLSRRDSWRHIPTGKRNSTELLGSRDRVTTEAYLKTQNAQYVKESSISKRKVVLRKVPSRK